MEKPAKNTIDKKALREALMGMKGWITDIVTKAQMEAEAGEPADGETPIDQAMLAEKMQNGAQAAMAPVLAGGALPPGTSADLMNQAAPGADVAGAAGVAPTDEEKKRIREMLNSYRP